MNKRRSTQDLAAAQIKGSEKYPNLNGKVTFTQMQMGVLVTAEIRGLPFGSKCDRGIFGFHIHSGESCGGTAEDPFSEAKGHYDNADCPHPYHAGDLPPLFGNKGYAYMSVFTDRFTVREIIGKTVIIHSKPDDFTTQPSGNSGSRIACGRIMNAR